MSNLSLFYLGQSLSFVYFWMAIAVPYLSYRGLSPTEIFTLMSIYQFMGVILEYPTGVLGDRFGHRRMTYLGNILGFVSMVVLAQYGDYPLYLLGLVILAIASGLGSGNDMGMLKAVSVNLKKDIANYNTMAELVLFVCAILGGVISQYSFELALYVSATCILLGNIPLYLIKNGMIHTRPTQSVIVIFKDGIKTLRAPLFQKIFIIVLLFGGFAFSTKTMVGNFGNQYGFSVSLIGVLIGLQSLARAVGSKLFAIFPRFPTFYPTSMIAGSLVFLALFPFSYVAIITTTFSQLMIGYTFSKIDSDIGELVSDHIRSSLYSLKRLAMRLTSSGYLLIYGFAVAHDSFVALIFATSLIFIIGIYLTRIYLIHGIGAQEKPVIMYS